jgi:hypothetical protein
MTLLISHQLQFVCSWNYYAGACSEEEPGGVIELDARSDISIENVFDVIQTKHSETK